MEKLPADDRIEVGYYRGGYLHGSSAYRTALGGDEQKIGQLVDLLRGTTGPTDEESSALLGDREVRGRVEELARDHQPGRPQTLLNQPGRRRSLPAGFSDSVKKGRRSGSSEATNLPAPRHPNISPVPVPVAFTPYSTPAWLLGTRNMR